MCLTVDKYIYLDGYGIYKPLPVGSYTVRYTIGISDGEHVLFEGSRDMNWIGSTNNCVTDFHLNFNKPILLEPFKRYKVYIRNGPNQIPHRFGINGKTEIKKNGVTFKIERRNNLLNKMDSSIQDPISSILFMN